MIPMPYILVNIVSDIVSMAFFCFSTAALLTKYQAQNLWLPQRLRHRLFAFFLHSLILWGLATAGVRIDRTLRHGFTYASFVYDLLFLIGLINAIVLAYQFMNKRYLLAMPRLQRRLLLGLFSVVVTVVPAFAAIVAIFGLFVIR